MGPTTQTHFFMIRTDNSTLDFYIYLQGTTRSATLLRLKFQLFKLTDSLTLRIKASYIPGVLNVLADALSRPSKPFPTEWMLHLEALQLMTREKGCPSTDLFATRFKKKEKTFILPFPDQLAWATNANNLFLLLGRTLLAGKDLVTRAYCANSETNSKTPKLDKPSYSILTLCKFFKSNMLTNCMHGHDTFNLTRR